MGNKKHATCFATSLQNELNSDVARFTTHLKPGLHQIRLLTGLNMGRVKHATSLFNSVAAMLQKKLHVFCCPFFRTVTRVNLTIPQFQIYHIFVSCIC